jgi:hypothetical protein
MVTEFINASMDTLHIQNMLHFHCNLSPADHIAFRKLVESDDGNDGVMRGVIKSDDMMLSLYFA